MMDYKELIDKLVRELSYRVGIPNIKDKTHQSIMSEILSEWGEFDAKQRIFEFLTEKDDEKTAEDEKYKNTGGSGYVKAQDYDKWKANPKGDFDKFTKTPSGKYVAKEDETGGEEAEEKELGTSLNTASYQKKVKKEKETQKKISKDNITSPNEDKKRITPITPKGNPLPRNMENLFSGESASVKNVYQYISDEDKQTFRDFEEDYRTLVSIEGKDERKLQAEKMVERYGLDSNKSSDQPNPKVYMRKVSPDARKILSGDGNKTSEELRDTIENALGDSLKGASKGGSNVKQDVTTTSKPDIGGANKEFIRTAEQDEGVRSIFSKEPYSYLASSMHELMGPVGEDGNLITPSSKNSKIYLKHSIEQNKSLEKTIEKLAQLEETDKVKPTIRKALESHQENMNRILNEYEIPSKEASEAVGSSYAVMAETLNEESGVLAGAMMKNMAEMALYDTEIANGDEAYLPSAGNFPSGDKIRVDRDGSGVVEKIAAVSVKYGKSGKFKAYGFPGETGQYQKFHPNEEYRDRLHSRPGDDGYNLGVKDEIVDNPIAIKQIISESGFGEAIKDDDKVIEVIQKMKSKIQDIKDEIGYIQSSKEAKKAGKPVAKKQLGSQKKKIAAIEKELASEMANYIDGDKLSELVGNDNAKLILSRPQCMITALTFGSTLTTSNGLDVIEHNHQEIADGKYITKTDTADSGQTKSLKNWALGWRAYDDRAGGLIAGANSARINY